MSDGRIRRGGGGVWRELYGFIYGYLRRCGLSHADAEDLAQDVLETAVVHLDAVEPGKLRAWLRVVARRKMLDHVRRAGRNVSMANLPEAPDPTPDPGELAIVALDREQLRGAISRLPVRDQELIRVRYLEERTVEQTSRQLGLSVGAAKIALMRARLKLAGVLKSQGGSNG